MIAEREAQRMLMIALLRGEALPGSIQPLVFPDTPDITEGRAVILIDQGDVTELQLPANVLVMRRDELHDALMEAPSAVILEFLPPEVFPGKTGARLQVSIGDRQLRPMPLGEIVATFTDEGGAGVITTDPTNVIAY